nr:hypothetical protein [Endozoicomonas sp.]
MLGNTGVQSGPPVMVSRESNHNDYAVKASGIGYDQSNTASASATEPSKTPVSQRKMSISPPDLSQHKQIAITLASQQMPSTTLDEASIFSIASSLCMAEINTVEKANELALTLTPPGPVFHTWYALHGTTLFDGKNNSRKWDYVATIEQEAEYFRSFKIPVLLIYSTCNMTKSQVATMSALFKHHPNLLTLDMENELDEKTSFKNSVFESHFCAQKCVKTICDTPQDRKKYELGLNVHTMDLLRYLILLEKDYVLETALAKAEKIEGKKEFSDNVRHWGMDVLTYSDIDIIQFMPNLYMLTESALINSIYLEGFENKVKPEALRNICHDYIKHRNQGIENKDSAKVLNEDFLNNLLSFKKNSEKTTKPSGRLHKVYDSLVNVGNATAAKCSEKQDEQHHSHPEATTLSIPWATECSYFRVGNKALKKINVASVMDQPSGLRSYGLRRWAGDKQLMLSGIQLLNIAHVNTHRTWRVTSQKVLGVAQIHTKP